MARSHHRKKHKAHLRQYQHSTEGVSPRIRKTKVTGIFTALGVALGLAIGYFSNGSVIAYIVGSVIGGAIGYMIGKKMDDPVRA